MVDAILSSKSRPAVHVWPHLRDRLVWKRIIFWAFVAVYTYFLPDVILAYNAILRHYSSDVAGKVPTIIVIVFGLAYAVFVLLKKRPLRYLGFLAPSAILAFAIVSLEPNPNKHIHISEYILMSWILFEAISIDYRGKGIFFLIFICSSMLGIVDELEQGIHPNRSYGWSDMLVNSTSTIIGILFLMGTRKRPEGDWAWVSSLKKLKGSFGLAIFGAIGAAFTCVYLFDVQSKETFQGVYPAWLLGWNGLSLFLASFGILYLVYGLIVQRRGPSNEKDRDQKNIAVTAYLWIILPLFILLIMHALVLLTFFLDWQFR
jgi:hypothetical protein